MSSHVCLSHSDLFGIRPLPNTRKPFDYRQNSNSQVFNTLCTFDTAICPIIKGEACSALDRYISNLARRASLSSLRQFIGLLT